MVEMTVPSCNDSLHSVAQTNHEKHISETTVFEIIIIIIIIRITGAQE